MKTLREHFGMDSAYWGERGNWLVAMTQHRDSDALVRSNFECSTRAIKAIEGEPCAIERASHWACGWVEYLLIDPESVEAVKVAEDIQARIEDYHVLDEFHFSDLENEEAERVWRDCFGLKERIKYIRENREQFDFRDFASLLGCVRGKYFLGWASELIS